MKKILILLFGVLQLAVLSQSTNLNGWNKNGNLVGNNTSFIGPLNYRTFSIKTNSVLIWKTDSTYKSRFTHAVSIGNSTVAATRDLDVHNLTGSTTGQLWSESSTGFANWYCQGSNPSYYNGFYQYGSAISFSNGGVYRNNTAAIDMTSPYSAIFNPVTTGTLAFSVGGVLNQHEILTLKSGAVSVGTSTSTTTMLGTVNFSNAVNSTSNIIVNSNTVAVIPDILFSTTHWHSNASSVSNVTYHFNQSFVGVSTLAGGTGVTYLPYDCTLVGFTLNSYVGGTLGTNTAIAVYVRVNNTTDITLTTNAKLNETIQTYNSAALNTNINAGNYIEIKVIAPTLTIPATNVTEYVTLFYKRR